MFDTHVETQAIASTSTAPAASRAQTLPALAGNHLSVSCEMERKISLFLSGCDGTHDFVRDGEDAGQWNQRKHGE